MVARCLRVACIVVVAFAAGSSPLATAQMPTTPPDVLLIISDDQPSSMFNRSVSPNVFREIVDRGANFTRAYVNSSLCCPSRAEILTGLYEHHTGVDENNVTLDRPTIVDALQDAGYRTMLSGKYLNSEPCTPLPEYDEWVCAAKPPSTYSLKNPTLNVNGTWTSFSGYTTDILADFVARFVETTPDDQPFFAVYAPPTPHAPSDDDRCFTIPVTPTHGPAFNEETRTSGKPEYMRRPPFATWELDTAVNSYARMTRAVHCLDASVGRLLASLGPRAANTLVVYVSDNGFLFGEHRRRMKVVPYEEAARVPFAIRYPPLLPEALPLSSDALVQNVDIAPTIAELAGIPWGADGHSLVPLLSRQAAGVRSAALLSRCQGLSYPCPWIPIHFENHFPVPSYAGVVTSDRKYLEYVTGEREHYDLATDPYELKNLAGDPAHGGVQAILKSLLDELMKPPRVETTIVRGPTGAVESRSVSFTYFSQSRLARYECRLTRDAVAGDWKSCNGQTTLEGPLPDGEYLFEVAGVDELGARDESPAARAFSVHSTGPDVRIDSGPPPDGDVRTVEFAFSSTSPHLTFECRLARWPTTASWTLCQSPVTYSSLADGLWNFEVRAMDPAGRASSPPAQSLFRISTTGSPVGFDAAPPAYTSAPKARLVFHPKETLASRPTCRFNGGTAFDCGSGSFDASNLTQRSHSLSVTTADLSGRTYTTTRSWVVDWTKPSLRIKTGPPAFWNSTSATFEIVASEPVTLFCKLETTWWYAGCSQKLTYTGLKDGPHTFNAIARDRAKNIATPVTWTWTQDTVRPVVTITNGPPSQTTSASATFSFTANETPVTFACALDGGAFAPCQSPHTYSSLAKGSHTFSVRATDRAGNVSDTKTYTWTVA